MLMQNIGGTIKSIVSRLSTIVRVNVVVSRIVVDSERVLWYFLKKAYSMYIFVDSITRPLLHTKDAS